MNGKESVNGAYSSTTRLRLYMVCTRNKTCPVTIDRSSCLTVILLEFSLALCRCKRDLMLVVAKVASSLWIDPSTCTLELQRSEGRVTGVAGAMARDSSVPSQGFQPMGCGEGSCPVLSWAVRRCSRVVPDN